jgi:formylglycine-generating enzyme required for sulfatase activity
VTPQQSLDVATALVSTAYTEPTTGLEFVAIPGGTFMMGDARDINARPVREVTVKPFLMGRYEVTYEQYAKFCNSTGRVLPSDNGWGMGNRPVVNVTWLDAVAFTEWLSAQSGKRMRLPSEAEWEYAARAGATTLFPWGDEAGTNKANCLGCGSPGDYGMTTPVGTFPPNGFGLYDMVGNVYEWCLDAVSTTSEGYEGAPTDGSAWVPQPRFEDWRINRGGSWFRKAYEAEVARRCWESEGKTRHDFGFRVAIEQ